MTLWPTPTAVIRAIEYDRLWFEKHADTNKRTRPYIPMEFMPLYDDDPVPSTVEDAWVEVEQIEPGVRVRRFVYGVLVFDAKDEDPLL